MLFLREVFAEQCRLFNSEVEPVQRRKKRVATHCVLHECVADVFDLACNNIAAREIRAVENRAENPFGEDMLNQHLLNGIL